MSKGLIYNDEPVARFAAECKKCSSADVSIKYEFNYYGGMTGYDQSLYLLCRSCENIETLDI